MAGYSPRPLAEKLGIKPQQHVALLHAPAGYLATLGAVMEQVQVSTDLEPGRTYDFLQAFYMATATLEGAFPALKAALRPTGTLWISWPKQAARLAVDVNETIVRAIGLANGLVDVKVAAVDEIWSGLKFVWRLADR